MRLADLSPKRRARLEHVRYDRIVEKHEGSEQWSGILRYAQPEFLDVDGHAVLLPIDAEHHPNVTIVRAIPSADGRVLTVFLRDTTYGHEWFDSGFMAVCEDLFAAGFYVTTVYHERFVVEQPTEVAEAPKNLP